VTLRDGGRTPVVFDANARLTIARPSMPSASIVSSGLPVTSPDDAEGVRAIAHAGLVRDLGFGRALAGDVKVNADCGVKALMLGSRSATQCRLWPDQEKGSLRVKEALARQVDRTEAFMPVVTRADMRFAERC
jgi:hypothetical protein